MSTIPYASSGVIRLALAAWLGTGISGAAWLAFAPLAVATGVWAVAIASWSVLAVAMFARWRNAYGYAMLMAILYTVVGVMDIIAYGAKAIPAVIFAAVALAAFFALIPATRQTRRRDTHE